MYKKEEEARINVKINVKHHEKELHEKNGCKPDNNELEDASNERASRICRIMNSLSSLDETGQAAVAMMMEKRYPTSMTTEHDTVVATTHTRQSLGARLKETLPNADLAATQSAVAKYEK